MNRCIQSVLVKRSEYASLSPQINSKGFATQAGVQERNFTFQMGLFDVKECKLVYCLLLVLAEASLDVRVHRGLVSSTFDPALVLVHAKDGFVQVHQSDEDGSELDWFVDPSSTQFPEIVRYSRPGEPLLGQSDFMSICFLSVSEDSIIASDAVERLRQRNPQVVRVADEQRDLLTQFFAYEAVASSMILNQSRIGSICRNSSVYISSAGLAQHKSWLGPDSRLLPIVPTELMDNFNVVDDLDKESEAILRSIEHCSLEKLHIRPCLCVLDLEFLWFPCAIKYCDDEDDSEAPRHRCGIRSCRQRRQMSFLADKPTRCIAPQVQFDLELN